jgi:hypothetical protein
MIVKDNYLDNYLYNEILNNPNFFPNSMGNEEKIAVHLMMYHEESSSSYSPFMFWDGWWRSPANTLKKKVIQKIWEKHLEWPNEDILGFEYWTRTYNPGQYIDLHVDEDTFLYKKNKTFQGPILGCVYYGVENKEGGFLELHKNTLIDGQKKTPDKIKNPKNISPIEDRERIAYKGNRLIIFDAGHIVHGSTPAKSNIRQVMVINVWHKDNPPLAFSNGDFFYE